MCLSAVKLDHSGKVFWDTPSWLSAWVSVFWAWRMDLNKGIPTLFAYCEKLIWKFFFKFNQCTCTWMAFAWNFFRIFLIFFFGGGSVGQIIYREYIVFRGSNISCTVASVCRCPYWTPRGLETTSARFCNCQQARMPNFTSRRKRFCCCCCCCFRKARVSVVGKRAQLFLKRVRPLFCALIAHRVYLGLYIFYQFCLV